MSTTGTPKPGTVTAFTMSLGGLASSAGLTVGRQSTLLDNTSLQLFDALVSGHIKMGTTPTINTVGQFWAIGGDGTDAAGGAGTTDAAFTPSPNPQILVPLGTINNLLTTTGLVYNFGPWSLAQAFGGFIPARVGLWFVHNFVAALDATNGNHVVRYFPLQTLST